MFQGGDAERINLCDLVADDGEVWTSHAGTRASTVAGGWLARRAGQTAGRASALLGEPMALIGANGLG